jgi:hypothetical protein
MKTRFRKRVQVGEELGRLSRVGFAVAFSFLLGQLMRGLAIFTVNWMLRDWKEYLALLSC